ncbi:MAG: FKBP-type peptidyl-prolyl cis-trans isomerase SlyD [Enterobacterales bacterium]|jgi:FKBP-type peptidyl-prolyl cis-trans isomerase SlyD
MSIVKINSVVTLNYQLKDEQGKILDSSDESGAMNYIQGTEDILQGIEDAVLGLSVNDKVSVTINPEQAYGEYDPELLSTIPIEAFETIENLHQGMQLEEETPDGPVLVTIKEVADKEVIVDANHPMAGHSLLFDLEIKEVRDASSSELDHGHVHHSDSEHEHGIDGT